jgi:ABC transporter substrate binding protein (PQQ-dependent alcohol dehydrogenase system)
MRCISRRTFLWMASTLGGTAAQWAAAPYTVAPARAQPQAPGVVRIAHLSRQQGDDSEIASYAIMGAQLGVEEANVTAGMFGTRVELIIEDATTADNMRSLTRKLAAQEHVSAIIAALDDSATAELSTLSQQVRVVCLNTCARGGELRGEKCQRLTFHVEPDLAIHTHALGQWLVQNNRKRWQYVVSEQLFGQKVYQRANRFLQQQGGADLGRSVITSGQSDFKDLLTHLADSDAEAVMVALRGEELRNFLEQYKATEVKILLAGVPLDMIALWQATPASLQSVWVTSWYHGLERFSARELNRRFSRRFEKSAESFAWANWAAVKLVVEGVLRSGTTDASALVNYFEGAPPFDGHKGKALTFRAWNHQLRHPLYVLKAREDKPENARDLLQLIAELPPPAAPGRSVVEVLDTLGEPQSESLCRLAAQ